MVLCETVYHERFRTSYSLSGYFAALTVFGSLPTGAADPWVLLPASIDCSVFIATALNLHCPVQSRTCYYQRPRHLGATFARLRRRDSIRSRANIKG
jgi:hypothetical protein